MYVVYESSSKNGYVHTSTNEMDLKTGEITTVNSEDPSLILNGTMWINTFKGADKFIVDDTFYYFQGKKFMKYDIEEKKRSKLSEDIWDGELFEFDGMIYVVMDFILSPMYDTVKGEAVGRGKGTENQTKKVEEKRDNGEDTENLCSDMTIDEARELILKEDGNYINV